MGNMKEAVKFLQDYCSFDEPNWLWIITGLSRNKDNSKDCHKFLRRMTVTSPEEIQEVYDEFHILCNHPDTMYRIYVSLNARDYVKALYDFQKKLIDIGVGLATQREDAMNLAKKAGSLWKTQLAQTQNRATKRVLLDIDTDDNSKINKLREMIVELSTVVHTDHATVSGRAIVIDACDTRGLVELAKKEEIPLDIQRDSMVFVEQWKGKS